MPVFESTIQTYTDYHTEWRLKYGNWAMSEIQHIENTPGTPLPSGAVPVGFQEEEGQKFVVVMVDIPAPRSLSTLTLVVNQMFPYLDELLPRRQALDAAPQLEFYLEELLSKHVFTSKQEKEWFYSHRHLRIEKLSHNADKVTLYIRDKL